MDYEQFIELFIHKKYDNINFEDKVIQKYYVEYLISNNNSIDNPTLKKNLMK